ncbi:transcriptional regulator GcvA [Marinobacterium aestuariivivens]|uniref:Transcriptional regulator GcvA n=1 Tax=Marinobacterium aestuariivivens TaxID=1698799 RepID=A0ABW2A6B8_9GAMM
MYPLKPQLPPMSSLIAFEAAARHLSFTRAAEELHLTQAAISRQIRQLEENLGLALFTRSHRAVRLTAEGRKFQHTVATALELLATAAGDLRHAKPHSPLSIAADLSIAAFWLMPRLPRFREAHPGIDIRVIASDDNTDRLEDGVDIAIQYGDEGGWPRYRRDYLLDEEVFPVCSPAYLARFPWLKEPADLLQTTLLHHEDEHWDWMDWRNWLASQGIRLTGQRQDLQINNYPLLIQAAIAGQGVALGWRHLLDDLLASGLLVRPIAASLRTRRGYYLITPDTDRLSPNAQRFCDWVKIECRNTLQSE